MPDIEPPDPDRMFPSFLGHVALYLLMWGVLCKLADWMMHEIMRATSLVI